MSNKKIITFAILAVIVSNLITISVLGFGVRAALSGTLINTEGVSSNRIYTYNKVKELIESYYVDEIDYDKLMLGSIKGLASALEDPYTEYMTKEEYDNLKVHTNANYAGIGIVVGVDPKDNLLLISEVFDNSPAQNAKMLSGDKIIQVNETYVDGDNFEQAVQMIKGPKGTKVNITILRENIAEPVKLEVTRDEIDINTVKFKMVQDNIGYIRIIQFGEKTPIEFDNALKSLKNSGMQKLVIDLRDNPGGLLDEVVDISGQIISNKLVVYTVDKNNTRNDYYPKRKLAGINYPIAVLINNRSASASEILAGVIKDYKKGILVGEKTFGKGVVQSVFPLSDGSGVKITTSKYYTPNGVSINKIGVEPDVIVELEDKNKVISKITSEEDLQLNKAIELLKND